MNGRNRNYLVVAIFLCLFYACTNKGAVAYGDDIIPVDTLVVSSHPCLWLQKNEERQLMTNIHKDAYWTRIHNAIINKCTDLLDSMPMERVLTGKRLLPVSREVLSRVFYLSYAYRTTKIPTFAIRAEREMLAAANFSDWNTSHFLDVAEMSLALSIGYDWLYDWLSESSRETIRNAIRDKGLIPSEDPSLNRGFLSTLTNWGQVCHGALACAALAIKESEPELATRILARSEEKMRLPMSAYNPDGSYPEGIGYWEYGTSFNVLYIAALEKVSDTMYDFTGNEAFLRTGEYSQQMIAPSLNSYNYMDNSNSVSVSSTALWFYGRTKDETILYSQRKVIDNCTDSKIVKDRLLPAMILWGVGSGPSPVASFQAAVAPTTKKYYYAEGSTPVCVMRTSWDNSNAMFVGFKGGSAGYNHGHMDVGSFMLEANGVRWAIDLGHQDYTSAEAGMGNDNFWDRSQESLRWSLLRLGNQGHNTLIINNTRQLVNGRGLFTSHSNNINNMNVVCDMSTVYANSVSSSRRGIAMIDQQYVVVEDLISTQPGSSANVRWNMTTEATGVAFNRSNNLITLTSSTGKKLYMKVIAPVSVTLKEWSTTPANSFETSNEGTKFVGFEFTLPAGTTGRIKVLLMPGEQSNVNPADLITD